MLKTTISLQVLDTNELLGARVLAANGVDDVKSGDRLSDGLSIWSQKLENQKAKIG